MSNLQHMLALYIRPVSYPGDTRVYAEMHIGAAEIDPDLVRRHPHTATILSEWFDHRNRKPLTVGSSLLRLWEAGELDDPILYAPDTHMFEYLIRGYVQREVKLGEEEGVSHPFGVDPQTGEELRIH